MPFSVPASVVALMSEAESIRRVAVMTARGFFHMRAHATIEEGLADETSPTEGAPLSPFAGADPTMDAERELVADDRATTEARTRFRNHGLPALRPDAAIAPLLGTDETLVAVTYDATVHGAGPLAATFAGTLYLTSDRLVGLGPDGFDLALDDLDEVGLVSTRLLLALRSRRGVTIDVRQPSLLRVQIAETLRRRQDRSPIEPEHA
jgi:hypothetical protein